LSGRHDGRFIRGVSYKYLSSVSDRVLNCW
jgi:hypothetical protein